MQANCWRRQRKGGTNQYSSQDMTAKRRYLWGSCLWRKWGGTSCWATRTRPRFPAPLQDPPAPKPNHVQNKQGRQHAWPAHQVLVRRIVRGFPLDDSRGFAHMDHVQVTGRKPAIRDHPHHDIVRGWPLVRHHHPDLKQTPRELTQWSANYFFPNKTMTQVHS